VGDGVFLLKISNIFSFKNGGARMMLFKKVSCLVVVFLSAVAVFAKTIDPPVITVNPKDLTAKFGDTAVFSVSATGDSISFRWHTDSAGILKSIQGNSARDSIYRRLVYSMADNGKKYCCVATNSAGKDTSTSATLTVLPAPTIVKQPLTDTVNLGDTAVFVISATSIRPPLSFQWQQRVSGGAYANITGATDTLYKRGPIVAGDAIISVRCAVTDSNGTANSQNASIVITNLPLPLITADPTDVSGIRIGDTATFKISASGVVTRYQWQRDSGNSVFTNISQGGPNQQDSAYKRVTVVSDTMVRSYRCIVSNTSGSDTSAAAKLITKRPAKIVVQPTNDTVKVGETASFKVSATSLYPPLSFQWMRRIGNQYTVISGATDSVYTYPNVADSNAGMTVRCALTDSAGTITSSSASIVLGADAIPLIVKDPADVNALVGDTGITFTVSSTGQYRQFRWQRDSAGVILPSSQTDSIYRIRYAVAAADSGRKYRCIVYNTAGSDTSAWATLHVKSTGIINGCASPNQVHFTARPNVVRANRPVHFVFNTSIRGPVQLTLSIYTPLGRIIYSQTWSQKEAENGFIDGARPWDLKTASGRTVSNGTYIAVMRIKNASVLKQEKTRFKILR